MPDPDTVTLSAPQAGDITSQRVTADVLCSAGARHDRQRTSRFASNLTSRFTFHFTSRFAPYFANRLRLARARAWLNCLNTLFSCGSP